MFIKELHKKRSCLILENDKKKAIQGEYLTLAKPLTGIIGAHYINKKLGLKRLMFRLPVYAAAIIGCSFIPIGEDFNLTR